MLSAHTRWSADQARPGERIALTLVITIAQGFHINADAGQLAPQAAFRPYPTRVDIAAHSPAVVVGPPHYPPAHTIAVGFTNQPLAVFDGRTAVTLPVDVPSDVVGDRIEIQLALHYQGCNATSCWMPAVTQLTARLPMTAKDLP